MKPRSIFRKALDAALLLFMLFLAACGQTATPEPQKDPAVPADAVPSGTEKDGNEPEPPSFTSAVEIHSGYGESNAAKPLPSQRIALTCMSMYRRDDMITVDAAMGDAYSAHQENDLSPSFSTFGINGHPLFEVYPGGEAVSADKVKDERLCINGAGYDYQKEFSKDEMSGLDISRKQDDISSYHHEKVTLDLSNYEAGTSGCVVFAFGWLYEYENPNHSDPSSLWEGQRRFLYFFAGEKGIAVSFDSLETAERSYNEIMNIYENDA